MKLVVCSVRDSAVDAFARPIFVPTTALAVRQFGDEFKNPDSQIKKHPGDFALFELGSFDEETGKFYNLETPRQLIRGSDLEISNETRS